MSASHKKKPRTWKDAKEHIKKTHRNFRKLIEEQIEKLKPDEDDRSRFRALLGTAPMEGAMRLSDIEAHRKFAEYVAEGVRNLRRDRKDLDFYHLTLLADEGIMSDRKPQFALSLLSGKADKAMRGLGLDGFYSAEVQALMNWPGKGKGRSLLGHVHILGLMPRGSPGNSAKEIRKALRGDELQFKKVWSSKLGAEPVRVLSLTEQRGCPSFWAAYLLKMPHDAKNLWKALDDEASNPKLKAHFEPTTKGYRPDLAMRIFEMFGQLALCGTVGGVGLGADILADARKKLKLWDCERQLKWKERGQETVLAFDEAKFWQRTHKNRKARYRRFIIDGPTIAKRKSRRRI